MRTKQVVFRVIKELIIKKGRVYLLERHVSVDGKVNIAGLSPYKI